MQMELSDREQWLLRGALEREIDEWTGDRDTEQELRHLLDRFAVEGGVTP